MNTTFQTLVCEVPLTATVPTEIVVVPWGAVKSKAGDFTVDDKSARLILAAFGQHGADLVIDWEHQTLGGQYSSPSGKAPAAGWIKALADRPGVGMVATVAWTDEAARDLAERKYRYLSPVIVVRKTDNRAIELHSVALTNKPAIVSMTPVVNKDGKAETMDYTGLLSKLRTLAGVQAEADETAILAALSARVQTGQDDTGVRAVLCKAIGLGAGADVQTVAAKATALKAQADGAVDLTQWVRREDHDVVVNRMATAETETRTTKLKEFIGVGMAKGKITEHARPYWESLYINSEAQAWESLKGAPVVAPLPGVLVNTGAATRGESFATRHHIILAASREFDANPQLGRLVSKVDHVNGELRQHKMDPMKEPELVLVKV